MAKNCCSLSVIGDGSVGKSSIIEAFKSDGFSSVYKQTIGCDFFEKSINLKGDVYLSLRVWDIGGQSINSRNMEKYLSNSQVIFLVYDVTNPESFANLDDWLSQTKKYAPQSLVYLVGNKIDLIATRQVSPLQHEQYISLNDLSGGTFLSAKTGENLVKLFYEAAGRANNTPLSAYELASHNKVLKVHIPASGDGAEQEGRTAFADEIEAEDMAAEMRKTNPAGVHCSCTVS